MFARHILSLAVFLALIGATPAATGPFGAWIGVVVAGDHTADGGAPTEVFDNARRDIADRLLHIGFESANVRQFSTQPGRYGEMSLPADYDTLESTVRGIAAILSHEVKRDPGGILKRS